MPSGRVITEGEVYLNGRFYRIDGPVRRDLISQQPPKISIGAFTKDDNPVVSTITWTKITGMGTATIETSEDYTKAYYSNMPSLDGVIATNAGVPGVVIATSNSNSGRFFAPGTSSTLYIITAPTGAVEVTTGTSLSQVTLASVTTATLGGSPTDSTWGYITTAVNSTVLKQYLLVARQGGLCYAEGPPYNTWTTNVDKALSYITIWDDFVWAINHTSNELMYAPFPGSTWTIEAKVPVPTFSITGLLTAPSEDDPNSLYVVTDKGLYLYDRENTRFAHIDIAKEPARNAGQAAIAWQGSIFYPAGISLFQYTPQAGTVRSVGLNLREGLPSDFNGTITGLAAAGKYLYAQVGSLGVSTVYEAIYRWDGIGWDQIQQSTALTTSYGLSGRPFVWFDYIGNVNRLLFSPYTGLAANVGTIRARESGVDFDRHYQSIGGLVSTGEMVLPWLKRDSDQQWLAVSVQADVTIPHSSQYVEISYGLNYSTAFTVIGGSSASGTFEHLLTTAASTNDQQGIAFDAIRLRVMGQSSQGSSAGSPTLKRLTFSYKKSFKPIYAFSFIVDATEKYKGHEPAQIREGLEAVSTTPTLVEFTFKDELSATNVTEQHWVSLQQMQSAEETGKDSGKFIVRVAEAL